MKPLILRRLPYNLTAHSGLALAGELLSRCAQINQVFDTAYPVRAGGVRTSDLLRSYVGLLCQGKSDFDAIERYRQDPCFARLLQVQSVPSAPTLRQRMDALGESGAIRQVDEANLRLLKRSRACISALPSGHVPCDIDVFTMDNSGTTKQGVGRTYAGVDGYAPIAAYLGIEGWCLALELRPGTQHSAKDTDETLQRLLPRIRSLTPAPILFRLDSGFDSRTLIRELAGLRQQQPCDWIVKWNPRGFDVAACLAGKQADPNADWVMCRPGKLQTTWIEATPDSHSPRRVMRLTERTIDKHGQRLLLPQIDIEGWWTSLDWDADAIICSYAEHGTHEQFHSEIKTDLDLERLPSGKFGTNDLVMALAMLSYNLLRHMGQGALLAPDAPPRHPAKRRRLKTVIQELILLAGRLTEHARQSALGLAHNTAAFSVFERYWRSILSLG
jgi:hypothetical protein